MQGGKEIGDERGFAKGLLGDSLKDGINRIHVLVMRTSEPCRLESSLNRAMAHLSDDWYSTPRPGKRSVERLDTEAIACCVVGVDCRQYGRFRFRFRGSEEFGDRLSEGDLGKATRILGSSSTDISQSRYSTVQRCRTGNKTGSCFGNAYPLRSGDQNREDMVEQGRRT